MENKDWILMERRIGGKYRELDSFLSRRTCVEWMRILTRNNSIRHLEVWDRETYLDWLLPEGRDGFGEGIYGGV